MAYIADLRILSERGTLADRFTFEELPNEGNVVKVKMDGRERRVLITKRLASFGDETGGIITTFDGVITE